jgi:hypothetical protein
MRTAFATEIVSQTGNFGVSAACRHLRSGGIPGIVRAGRATRAACLARSDATLRAEHLFEARLQQAQVDRRRGRDGCANSLASRPRPRLIPTSCDLISNVHKV